jgi:putative transposase
VKEEPMRKSPFSDEQMMAILRETDRTMVTVAAEKNKVGEQPIYAWRKQFGQLEPTHVKALKALSVENAKLNRLLAERELEIGVMNETSTPAHRHRASATIAAASYPSGPGL